MIGPMIGDGGGGTGQQRGQRDVIFEKLYESIAARDELKPCQFPPFRKHQNPERFNCQSGW